MYRFIFWIFLVGVVLANRGLLVDATISVARLASEKYQHPMSYQKFTESLLNAKPRTASPKSSHGNQP